MFDIFINAIAGGAHAAHDAVHRQDNGSFSRQHGSLIYAENGVDCQRHGEVKSAAYFFGRAGEVEGGHNTPR